MRYFKNIQNKQVASLTSEKLIMQFTTMQTDEDGNAIKPSDWVEISETEYNQLVKKPMLDYMYSGLNTKKELGL